MIETCHRSTSIFRGCACAIVDRARLTRIGKVFESASSSASVCLCGTLRYANRTRAREERNHVRTRGRPPAKARRQRALRTAWRVIRWPPSTSPWEHSSWLSPALWLAARPTAWSRKSRAAVVLRGPAAQWHFKNYNKNQGKGFLLPAKQ